MSVGRWAVLAAAMIWAAAPPAEARHWSFSLGAGPAFADRPGGAALVAAQFHSGPAFIRADARGFSTGRNADWENSSRLVALGAGVGAEGGGAVRRYALATVASGIDLRESDRMTALGAAAGLASAGRTALFGEIRYERWFQHGPVHHDLPSHAVSAVVGVRLD